MSKRNWFVRSMPMLFAVLAAALLVTGCEKKKSDGGGTPASGSGGVAAPTSGGGATPGVTATEIKIGQTMPYSGPASAYGVIGKTEQAFFKMINEKGGVNGRKI